MSWQPEQLTRSQMAERRAAAIPLLREGELSQAEIARHLGVSRTAVTKWKQRLGHAGRHGLPLQPPAGRPTRLSDAQWTQLLGQLQRGACAAGFETERWTLRRIAQVTLRTFGVGYHPSSLGRALHARGWSPQQPVPRAREQDEELIAAWLHRDWPRIQRGLAAQGVRLPSWTRRVTRFGPGSAPPGRPPGSRPSCPG